MPKQSTADAQSFPVAEFLAERELNRELGISSPDDVLQALHRSHTGAGFISEWEPMNLYYRGQSNGDFGVSSSLYRFLRQETTKVITEQMMLALEGRMLDDLRRDSHLGRNLTDGQLLMILQHYGAPTRLVDVSKNPLEALFFACDSKDGVDGRLFFFSVLDRQGTHPAIDLATQHDLPWIATASGDDSVRNWTRQVSAIDSPPLDPRMGAQTSAFLVGGVLRTNRGLPATYGGRLLTAAELVAVSTLTIGFPKRAARDLASSPWNALGWSIRIKAEWKPALMHSLSAEGITHDSIYPPFGEVAWKAETSMRKALRTKNLS